MRAKSAMKSVKGFMDILPLGKSLILVAPRPECVGSNPRVNDPWMKTFQSSVTAFDAYVQEHEGDRARGALSSPSPAQRRGGPANLTPIMSRGGGETKMPPPIADASRSLTVRRPSAACAPP